MLVQHREAGGTPRNPEDDPIVASHKDRRVLTGTERHRFQNEPPTKQRFCRIRHLNRLRTVFRVVERGINKWCGSTPSITTS